jgi:hypothetical protein
MATGTADPQLLDAAARMLRLLDSPLDAPVLAPLIERPWPGCAPARAR